MISTHLYFYKNSLSNMDIYFSKEKKKKPTNLKTYLFVKLLFLNEEKHNFLKFPIL